MTDWQQALDRRLVQRLQPPLAKKNMGQRLVDRTDRFLTRFSLVEQQFQRWGNFQATNPNPVPVVFAKPRTPANVTTPSTSTAVTSAAIATPASSPDVFVQRKIDPTISTPSNSSDVAAPMTPSSQSSSPQGFTESVAESSVSENFVEPNLWRSPAETPPDVIFVENNPPTASDLPLLENTVSSGSEPTEMPVDISSQASADAPIVQPESVAKEATTPDLQLVSPAENLTEVDPASEELVLWRSPEPQTIEPAQNADSPASEELAQRRSPDNFPPDFEQSPNPAITSQLITAQFSDVPLVLAQPVSPSLLSKPQRQAPEPLPVVRTRLEQLLNQRKFRSQLPTVQPQKVTQKVSQPAVTPLTKSVDRSVETSANNPVQPLPTAQNLAQAPTLSFGNAANATQQGRSPTSPLSSFPKPPSPTTQTNAHIANPNVQAAQNPIVETFRAPAMENSAPSKVDIQAIADQVEKKIRRRIVVESERRGQGKWR